MVFSLQDRLLRREVDAGFTRYTSIAGIYGDKHWVDNLDIVNELGGHHGCVNALSWSKSGRLLASGSDDTNIVLHAYHPDQSNSPFSLTTSIDTGHTANIFSVKFMPHSNDSLLVSAAGDSEVRVFDVEYSNSSRARSNTANSADVFAPPTGSSLNGVKYLSERNTNARVYRSHSDRVKRIVTESSPHLFLTCSEDGEVRQWDLRLPSSAYPSPRGGRGFLARRADHDDSNVPPPLISYKRFRLDLNTISCSASQPHYIVLGGAHLHCFLHDRRMLGRDLDVERGSPGSTPSIDSDIGSDMMGQATRCVRRFAPNGKSRMGSRSNGHVTACKISDASPNEMIASWSGDHIYSFDLIKSPDAHEHEARKSRISKEARSVLRSSRSRKRKRAPASVSQGGLASRPRRSSGQSEGDIALRVRYENGQSEDIALDTAVRSSAIESARESMLTASQRRSLQIARSIVKIRRLIFSLEGAERGSSSGSESTIPTQPFSSVLEIIISILPDVDDIIRSWTYPVDPDVDEVNVHKELRRRRDATRRFIQAAGVISTHLGGTVGGTNLRTSMAFDHIMPHRLEGPFTDEAQIFNYDFLKAIFLWIQGGLPALCRNFSSKLVGRRVGPRFPIPPDELHGDHQEVIQAHLIPYLRNLAGTRPVPNVDASRFEVDENRHLFPTELSAVEAFANAIKIPFAGRPMRDPLSEAQKTDPGEAEASSASTYKQELKVARRFWGFKVGRGLLMNASEGVNYASTDTAFGGLGHAPGSDSERDQSEIDPDEEELLVDTVAIRRSRVIAASEGQAPQEEQTVSGRSATVDDATDGEDPISDDGEQEIEDDDDSADENDDVTEDSDGEGVSEDNSEEGGIIIENSQFLFRSSSDRARLRANVNSELPVNGHTRSYRGHCNVKTVKDVNFYGLNDEYVVSGSDSGHLFIWEKSTSKLLNILEGDGEVVNVIQGHPHEPMLAVSGIDHTIKIFSPDARAQREARLGINLGVSANQSSGYSSLGGGVRRWRRRSRPTDNTETSDETVERRDSAESEPLLRLMQEYRSSAAQATTSSETAAETGFSRSQDADSDKDDDSDLMEGLQPANSGGLSSRRRMQQSYQITAQNDIERENGHRDAFMTRGMLEQLARHMRSRGISGEEGDEIEEGEGTIVLDDECSVM